MYTEAEISEIRDVLGGKWTLSPEQRKFVRGALHQGAIPDFMNDFSPLLALNPDLYQKISQDDRAKQFSILGFFPETYDLFYGSETSPKIFSPDQSTRLFCVLIGHPDRKLVIKYKQSEDEEEIARIAGELKTEPGPKQYNSINGFLTEEFIEGTLYPEYVKSQSDMNSINLLGRRTGEILQNLHSRQIFYNDLILTDDFAWKSHLIIPENGRAKLIDYGVALKLDNHPNLTDEQVFNYIRTFAGINMAYQLELMELNSGGRPVEVDSEIFNARRTDFINTHRKNVQSFTKEQIMERDVDFIREGLGFTSMRFGDKVSLAFWSGFIETYK